MSLDCAWGTELCNPCLEIIAFKDFLIKFAAQK